MSANTIWSSREDVLNDLNEVTGGHAALSDLDDYVADGQRPPPDRKESINGDEIQHRFGVLGSGGDGAIEPDLQGITQLLKLVNEDQTCDNEPKTIFRDTITDEIRISKLNPYVTDFVPSNIRKQPQLKQKTPKKKDVKPSLELEQNNQECDKVNSQNKISNQSKICDVKKEKGPEVMNTPNYLLNERINKSASNSKGTVSSNDIFLDKKVDVSNMKVKEIEEIKTKIKSKIMDSSSDSIQHKKQKNVAMATLLRLCAAEQPPAEKPIKLITPDYFEIPPTDTKTEAEKEREVKDLTRTVEGLEGTPSTTSSSIPVVYKDPFVEESIAKVNDWFDNADKPKETPKPLPVPPTVAAPVVRPPVPLAPSQFRGALSFKKKNTSTLSINSRKSETSIEKPKQNAVFVPSSYANDLLQKYEKNAKKQAALNEDWGTALERQLREKDEAIRKKIRDKQEAKPPSSGSGN